MTSDSETSYVSQDLGADENSRPGTTCSEEDVGLSVDYCGINMF